MNTNNKTTSILEDAKINVKIKLAALWVALMSFYIYRDIVGFMEPGHLEKFMAGEIGGMRITQAVLLGSAILQAIPSVMVYVSVTLKAKANRWANIILGIVYIAVLGGTFFSGIREISALYLFYASVIGVLLALIVWHAWQWPNQERVEVTP